MISVLFVCQGNICRSPALEATLRHIALKHQFAEKLHIDSCGMGWMHVGQLSDRRTFAAAKKRGILIEHRAQQFQDCFFDAYHYLFASDSTVLEQLRYRARKDEEKEKIFLATAYSKRFKNLDIPDPYYLSPNGFDEVMEIVIDSCEGLFAHLRTCEK